MGNYATAAQLKARFDNDRAVAHLTHDSASGTPNDDLLNEMIDEAEEELNTLIGVKWETPVKVADHASLAALMKGKTLAVASLQLHAQQHSITDAVQVLHDKALEWAEKISVGTAVLPSTDTEPSTVSLEPGAAWGTSDSSDPASNRRFDRVSTGGL